MSIRHGLIFFVVFLFVADVTAEEIQADGPLPDPVTHTRMRTEPVQWTPESITVITAEEIEATFRRDLEDLQGIAPGLIVDELANTPRGAAIGVRGITSGNVSKGFQPAVAVLVDGVYVGTHTDRMQTLYDVEQVEIARGSRGSLQGAPAPGGSINIRRARPTGELDLDARASADQHNGRQFDARLDFPITDSLAGKITMEWARGGGEYMDNVVTPRGGENEDHRQAVSGSLLWKYNDNIEVQYTYDSEIDDSESPALLNISTPSDLVCINAVAEETCGSEIGKDVPQTRSIDLTAQNFSNERAFEGDYHTLRVDFDAVGHAFTSITGVRDTTEAVDQDLDATFVNFYSSREHQDYSQFTQEFRMLSRDNDKLRYVAGAWFMDSEYDRTREDFYILNALEDAGLTSGIASGQTRLVTTTQDLALQSWFASLDYVLSDQWTADLGYRYYHVEKEFEHRPLGARVDNVIPSTLLIIGRQDWNEYSANAGLRYKVDDEAMIFFRYTWDFLPGGFNDTAVSVDSASPRKSEKIHGYEAGLKSEWYNDHLRLNATTYRTQWEDKAEPFVRTVASGRVESVVDNVATVDVHGLDVEVEWIPVDNLHLRGSFSHISANYDRFMIPDLTDQENFVDLSGLLPNRAPVDNFYVSARYSFPWAEGRISAFFGYLYSSDYQTNPRIPVAKVGNFTTVDLSVDYTWREWTFRLFARNVNDNRYLQNVKNPTAADVISLDPGTRSPQPLVTFSEYNRPRYTGFQVIYRPEF